MRRRFAQNNDIVDINNYMTIVALEDNVECTIPVSTDTTPFSGLHEPVFYSINGSKWIRIRKSTTISIDRDSTLSIKANGCQLDFYNDTFVSGLYSLMGNIMSLIYLDDTCDKYDLMENNFISLFSNTLLTEVSESFLPATTLTDSCYKSMFYNCQMLTTPPKLPATTLTDSCYKSMFYNCQMLTTPPKLPATTLADSCYNSMFYGANVLPDCSNIDFYDDSVVASGGLRGLFMGTKVTDNDLYNILPLNSNGKYYLPATTLANYCYAYMFSGCASLTTAPDLPATTLTSNCYECMFQNCTSLTTAPELPATTLANYCYDAMFDGCTSLTTAPDLPTTTLAFSCYEYMFRNCTSLTTAPELPATTLAGYCYRSMFRGCISLTTAPELPATTLVDRCYAYMFQGCVSLTTPPKLPATTLANYCYSYMFSECTSLTTAPELPATTLNNNCYYSMFYGTNMLPDCSNIDFYDDSVVASGGLKGLFEGTNITDNDLYNILPLNSNGKYYLPATTLANECYVSMFRNCTSLTTAPELPATTLAKNCYQNMFSECTSLTTAPELPATTLVDRCYNSMFFNCTSLTTAPELPATTLANYCYDAMFDGCTSLTTAPDLPAIELAGYCYYGMFNGCGGLNYIKMLATNISALYCLSGWVSGVASTGTFVKNKDATWFVTSSSGVPVGWDVVFEECVFKLVDINNLIILNNQPFDEGMTWQEFANSDYNTDNKLKISSYGTVVYDGRPVKDKAEPVSLNDIIKPTNYLLDAYGSGGSGGGN